MDTGVKTPLIDFFRRGDVAHDVRLQAAQGGLAARAHEQLALLALLSADPEPDVAAAADRVLADADTIAASLAGIGEPELSDPARTARVLRTAAESFENFEVVAAREAEMRAELARLPDVVATVPTFTDDVHDVEGLWRIAERLLVA